MPASPFSITPTPPTSLQLEPGQDGKFSFTVTSLAAPDTAIAVVLQALLLDDEGRGKEVDWLVVGPQRTLSISGGKTETLTITARPNDTSPVGPHRVKLVVADKGRPNDVFADSPPVTCEVLAPKVVKGKTQRPSWLIPAIVAGGVVLVGGVVLLVVKLTSNPSPSAHGLGATCSSDAAGACDPGLVCDSSTKTCLGDVGAACKVAADCETGLCTDLHCANKPPPPVDAAVDAAPPVCGHRGQPCCSGTCELRASCDGAMCIAADVWASGADGTFDFNGGSWTHPLLGGSTAGLPAVNGLWGTTSSFVVGVGRGGLILRFDGTRWNRDRTSAADGSGTLKGVAGSSASDIWAVGDDRFVHYNGGGWTDVPLPNTNGEGYYAVWLSGPGEGWACGLAGVTARLTGGKWTQVARQGGSFDKNGVWGSAANDVWMVGHGHSLATGSPLQIQHFDGTTWSNGAGLLDPQGTLPPLNAVWGSDATHVWAVGDGGTIVFWNGTLWRSVLSGTSDNLSAVWGSGPNDVWVAGSGGVRHFNGSAWSTIPGLSSPPVALWLSRD